MRAYAAMVDLGKSSAAARHGYQRPLGATVGAAPKAAPDTDLITASLRDPSGAPLILVCGAVASWELLDATHHIVALGRSH